MNSIALRILTTLLLILGSITAALAAPAAPRLKVGYAPGGGSILAFIAQDQKLFAKEGIDVELVQDTGDGLIDDFIQSFSLIHKGIAFMNEAIPAGT